MHAGAHTAERVTVSSQGAVAWCGGAALGGRLVVTDAEGVVTADLTTPEHVAGITFDARGTLYATLGEAVVAFGPSGSERWRHDFRAGDGEGRLDAIAVAPDGDLVVVGSVHSDDDRWSLRILRLAPDGAPRWDKGLPGELAGATADTLAMAADGDIVIGGERDNSSYAWVARLDPQGEPRWSHLFGGGEGIHRTRRVAVGPHGVIVAGGRSRPSDGELDSWVAHVDASGATWQRSPRGPAWRPDQRPRSDARRRRRARRDLARRHRHRGARRALRSRRPGHAAPRAPAARVGAVPRPLTALTVIAPRVSRPGSGR